LKLAAIKTLLLDRYNRRTARMRPLYLEGIAGIGKTEIVRQAAEELHIPCKVVCLAAMEAADFSGLPRVDPKSGETRYARPNWLPNGPAVIFFDELNRAAADTLQPMLTLIQDRHINGHEVHPESMFAFAGNPTGGEYNTQELDPAMKERVSVIKVEADYTALTGLLGARYPGCVLEMNWMISQAKLSPRSIEFTLRAIEGVKKDTAQYLALLTAEIGAESAGAMLAFLKRQKNLTADQVELTKKGELTADTRKLIKDTWNGGAEAIPTFTSLAKELISKLNASAKSGDKKDFANQFLTMLEISDATGDTGCASIYLDLYMEIEDRNEVCVSIFEAVKKKDKRAEIYRNLLKEEIAQVEFQK
jgi:AAA domain (dynein-related subfamily)